MRTNPVTAEDENASTAGQSPRSQLVRKQIKAAATGLTVGLPSFPQAIWVAIGLKCVCVLFYDIGRNFGKRHQKHHLQLRRCDDFGKI